MTDIIAAIVFILISIIMITTDATVLRHNAYNFNLQANVITEAKELHEFTQAAYDYSESFNVPLSTTSLTVSNLQSYGLLSSTFPETTPFGQSFVATYSTDTCNQDVIDMEVYTSGDYNTDLMAKNGLSGTIGTSSLNSQVENYLSKLNISFVNAHNPCINGGPAFYIGQTQAGSNVIDTYAGGTISTSNTASINGVAMYIYAPNQWGYLTFTITDAIMDDSATTNGTSVDVNVNNLENRPAINILGWGLSCPVGSTVINNTYSQNYVDKVTFFTNGYCVPAYKSQVNSLNKLGIANLPQVFNLSGGQSFYGNFSVGGTDPGNAYMYGGNNISQTNSVSYLNPVSGINNNIYGVESYFQSNPPYYPIPNGQYPGANFIPLEPLYNFFDSSGVDISVNGAIYQIVAWKYSLITGQGIIPTAAGMNQCNPEGTCFPAGATIWQYSGGINVGTSFDNYGGGYYITENPANPESYNAAIEYVPYNNGPTYADSFTVPTALIN